ncbi:methyltransferase domain-containing protein [Hahella sp. KA22]|uniref:CheR family methyltransferase n=1 Tax=Hahella sp. KA22 TaxID=1628392 RepID=UPI000FDD4887|nr:protein-glutamate O-methyltransferase CheR [Hahella sp. KA22]AZZ91382.1 protein-glutamate O-methyltransferase CheR [Hahella sp. KA22]QAY54752.1 methyltransferase domain-containing protein [Hahella sp. KA22]
MVNNADYDKFRDFLQKACGIVLGDNKQYLVQSRLRRIMADEKIETVGELVDKMSRSMRSPLREAVVDAMTTNETLWFRDVHPFRILEEKILPELSANKGVTQIRIWSAACSTGQEPYSISMVTDEYRRKNLGGMRAALSIVATDLSASVLSAARKGEYEMLAIGRGLSKERMASYFTKTPDGSWKIKPEVARCVEFRSLNLLDSYSLLGKFDVIFCRNVLIYFSAELKKDILSRMHSALKPGGYLILGASESLGNLPDKFEMVHCSPGIIYRAK